MDRATQLLENARKQFLTNGAVWDERTAAAVRSLISSHLLEVEHLTMPPEVVEAVRYALLDSYSPLDEARAWVDTRYDVDGTVLP